MIHYGIALGSVESTRKNEELEVTFNVPLESIRIEHIKRLEAEVNHLKMERNQLLSDLVETNNCNLLCIVCKYKDNNKDTFPCSECKDEYAAFVWDGLKDNSVGDEDAENRT